MGVRVAIRKRGNTEDTGIECEPPFRGKPIKKNALSLPVTLSISTTVVEILMHPMRNLAISVGMAVVCCTTQAQVCLKSVRWYSDIPYAFRGTDGQIQGLDIDIARTAL